MFEFEKILRADLHLSAAAGDQLGAIELLLTNRRHSAQKLYENSASMIALGPRAPLFAVTLRLAFSTLRMSTICSIRLLDRSLKAVFFVATDAD